MEKLAERAGGVKGNLPGEDFESGGGSEGYCVLAVSNLLVLYLLIAVLTVAAVLAF